MVFYTFSDSEIKDLSITIIFLTFLFSLLASRFSEMIFFEAFIYFLIFFIFLFVSRILFMKYIGYRIGFMLTFYNTSMSKWGFKKYQNVKAYGRDLSYSSTNQALDIASSSVVEKEKLPIFTKSKRFKVKGIPSIYVSLFLYVITFGLLIFPSIWRYKIDKVPHMFIGTKHRFETGYMRNIEISGERVMKALFMGFVFYFIFAIFLKIFLPMQGITLWFYFALFWIAFITLLPIMGTEGYDLFVKSRFAYISAVTILALGMFSLFIFSSITSILLISIPIILLVLAIVYYKVFLFV